MSQHFPAQLNFVATTRTWTIEQASKETGVGLSRMRQLLDGSGLPPTAQEAEQIAAALGPTFGARIMRAWLADLCPRAWWDIIREPSLVVPQIPIYRTTKFWLFAAGFIVLQIITCVITFIILTRIYR